MPRKDNTPAARNADLPLKAALIGLLLCTFSAAAGGQRVAPGDSARLARRARQAVARLEQARMAHLPRGIGGGGAGRPCPTRIGSMCHWPEGENAPGPPTEDRAVTAERESAIAVLDTAAGVEPSDAWLVGEEVALEVQAGRPADAVRAAGACKADRALCAELLGYALDAAGEYESADSAFGVGLEAMQPAERCAWESIAPLLQGALAERYGRADCGAREVMARRIWWLAAPLYLVSTVDARTAYYSRLVRARIADLEPSGEPFGWNDDVRAVATRYGWPVWYSQDPPAPGALLSPAVVGHERGGAYYFFPTSVVTDSIGSADSTGWSLDDPHAPAAYAPPYTRSIHELDVRVARFRRPHDSTLIVAAWDGRADSTLAATGLRAALFVGNAPDSMQSTKMPAAFSHGALSVQTQAQAALVSVELLNDSTRRAARARRGVRALPVAAFGLSDLLVFHPEGGLASRLDDAAPKALASTADSSVVGLFWELYAPTDTRHAVEMRLRVAPIRQSWFDRAAARLRLHAPRSALALRWAETPAAAGVTPRSLRLDLSGLHGGWYRMELTAVNAPGTERASATRDLFVPGGG